MKPIKYGLIIFLLTVPTTINADQSDPLAATVNNYKIHESYIYQKIEELPLGDQIDLRDQIDRFLESVIQEEVLFQSVLSNDFQDEPELRDEVKSMVAEFLIEKYVGSKINITQEAIQKYYEANLSQIRGEHVRARYMRLANQKECEALEPLITSEESFANLTRKRSLDNETAINGGDTGYLMIHFNELGFEAQLFGLPLEKVHTFETPKGCYLVWITEHLLPIAPPLEQVTEDIKLILTRGQESTLLKAFLEERAKTVSIKRFP